MALRVARAKSIVGESSHDVGMSSYDMKVAQAGIAAVIRAESIIIEGTACVPERSYSHK